MTYEGGQGERGIDLFDFLYEIWVSRWAVLAILVLFLLLGALSSMSFWRGAPDVVASVSGQSRVAFSIDAVDDPMRRSVSAILADFLSRVEADGDLDLSSTDNVAAGIARTERTYKVTYSPATNAGAMTITLPTADAGAFGKIDATLRRLCAQQGSDVKARQEKSLAVIDDMRKAGQAEAADRLASREFLARTYLALPEVQAGTFCLVKFGQMMPVQAVPGSGHGSGMTKRIVLAGLVGGVVAVFFVMFRIGIRRRKAKSGSATSPA